MSEVEETLERIKNYKGVEGYVICDKSGHVLRRYPSANAELADLQSRLIHQLALKARHTVRDLEPNNELKYMRIRATKKEIMAAYDNDYLVIIIQSWMPSQEAPAQSAPPGLPTSPVRS